MKLPIQSAPIVRGSIQNTIHSKTKMYSASSISPSAICIAQNGVCNYMPGQPAAACGFANSNTASENVTREVTPFITAAPQANRGPIVIGGQRAGDGGPISA